MPPLPSRDVISYLHFIAFGSENYNWKSFFPSKFERVLRKASFEERKRYCEVRRSKKVLFLFFRKRFVINYNFNYCLYRREVSLKNTSLFLLRLSSGVKTLFISFHNKSAEKSLNKERNMKLPSLVREKMRKKLFSFASSSSLRFIKKNSH